MKIGVTGSVSICDVIKKTLAKRMPELEVFYMCTNSYQESMESVEALQQMDLKGIIFTGPTIYQYVRKRVEPTVPWTFIPHNQAALLKALLEASVRFSCVPDIISIDMYEKPLIEETMQEVGICSERILTARGSSPDDPDLEEALTRQHIYHYTHEGAKVCITNMENTYQALLKEKIPCIRISSTEDVVMEQVYHLQLLEVASNENRGRIACVQLYFDYSFDQETDLSVREWEKIYFQNEMKELIYSAAHRMGAAAFCEGASSYYIMTNRKILMSQFIQNGEYQKIISHGQQTPRNRVWIGIGFGSSALEAKSRASMALNHSIADRSGIYYMAEDEHQVTRLQPENLPDHTSYLLHRLHISSGSYAKLKAVLEKYHNQITSAQLAEELGITERSANRLILKLEQENCVTTVGKISSGKGRPARIMKITL